jgi:hypothetical protein
LFRRQGFKDRGGSRGIRAAFGPGRRRITWLQADRVSQPPRSLTLADRLGRPPGDDAKGPGRESRGVVEPGKAARDLDSGVLHDVAGEIHFAGEAPDMADKLGLPTRREALEGVHVTGPRARGKVFVQKSLGVPAQRPISGLRSVVLE